jgi:hypothetical protein
VIEPAAIAAQAPAALEREAELVGEDRHQRSPGSIGHMIALSDSPQLSWRSHQAERRKIRRSDTISLDGDAETEPR